MPSLTLQRSPDVIVEELLANARVDVVFVAREVFLSTQTHYREESLSAYGANHLAMKVASDSIKGGCDLDGVRPDAWAMIARLKKEEASSLLCRLECELHARLKRGQRT